MEKTARERNFFRQTHHYFKIMPVKLQKVPRKSPRHDRKSVCRGESLKLVSVNFCKMLFLCSERDFFADFGKHLRGDAEERGEVLQGKMLNDAGTALQQQLIALAGCGAVEVGVAGTGLTE